MDKKYDLEERLVRFAGDFVHKNGIVLKELKESRSTLKILTYSEFGNAIHRALLLKEYEELFAIFGKIIFNTRKNMNQ